MNREQELEAQCLSLIGKIYAALNHPDLPSSIRQLLEKGHTASKDELVERAYHAEEHMNAAAAEMHGALSQRDEAVAQRNHLHVLLKLHQDKIRELAPDTADVILTELVKITVEEP